MYFSKKTQQEIKRKIERKKCKVFAIKLYSGVFTDDEDELKDLVDTMFVAWKKIVSSRSYGFIRNFDGILRRLFFDWSEEKGGFSSYFYLVCVQRQEELSENEEYEIKLAEEKLRLYTYVRWLSSWVTALKLCTDVSVGFSVVDLENLEAVLSNFCTNEKYALLGMIDEAKKKILKDACGNHRLVSFHGIFRELNRHVSVER